MSGLFLNLSTKKLEEAGQGQGGEGLSPATWVAERRDSLSPGVQDRLKNTVRPWLKKQINTKKKKTN